MLQVSTVPKEVNSKPSVHLHVAKHIIFTVRNKIMLQRYMCMVMPTYRHVLMTAENVLWSMIERCLYPPSQEDQPMEEGGVENGSGDGDGDAGEESEGGREEQRDSQLLEDFRRAEDGVVVINRQAEDEEGKVRECV